MLQEQETQPMPEAPPAAPSEQPVANASQEERNWAMFTHLSALAGVLVPFGSILGPLVLWLIGKDKYPSIDAHGKEALNFNITVVIAAVVSAVLILVIIGLVLLIAVAIAWVVLVIMATIKVSQGEFYRYPVSLRLVK